MIRVELPGSVYRCKGFVVIDGDEPQQMLLQTVGRRSELTPTRTRGAGGPVNRIVAIASKSLDEDELRKAFDDCLVP